MQIALRLLIAGYIVAAIAWSIALIPPRIIGGDLGTAMIFVTAFGCTQVLLALLFLGSAITAARHTGARISQTLDQKFCHPRLGICFIRSDILLFVVLLLCVTCTMGLTNR